MKAVLPCFLLVVSLAGCGTARRTQQPAIHIRDSVSVRYEERHVTGFDTAHVALPQESSAFETPLPSLQPDIPQDLQNSLPQNLNGARPLLPDTVSHLETSAAVSDVIIDSEGNLHHTLTNKPSVPVLIPHDTVYIRNDSIVYREREDTGNSQPEPEPPFFKRLASSVTDVLALIGAITVLLLGVRFLRRRVMKC